MKYGRNKNKIFASLGVFLVVVFAFVALAISFPQKKVNAGVIVESNFGNFTSFQGASATDLQGKYFGFNYFKFYGTFEFQGSWNTGSGTTSGAMFQIRDIGFVNDKAIMHARWSQQTSWDSSIQCYFTTYNDTTYVVFDILQLISNVLADGGTAGANITILSIYSNGLAGYNPVICEISNTISQVSNIYDLENNTLTLLYLSDINGLNTSAMRDEITINWGYIDQTDNTIFAEYAPAISAQNLLSDDDTIRLGLPVNAQGDAMQYYDISQQAILSISGISTGSATATANIYGVYVWRNENNIKWGLANFNTATNPQSAMSMNYITSFTELYDYQNINTATMTCRLSVSNNFNFITIKNQTSVNVDNVNAVIQQGGFLPAWAVYNWARGTYSGFIAGDASARADYAEGKPAYEAIFQAGYQAGFDSAEIGTGAWFITAFDAVDRFLNISIFPNITFGVLLGIPFVISLAWFIIRMFRGGGGD